MFYTRGRTIMIIPAWKRSLREILKEYIGLESNGRIIYYSSKFCIYIELLEGNIAGIVVCDNTKGNTFFGGQGLEILRDLLDEKDGTIEIIELDREKINMDLEILPDAKLSEDDLRTSLNYLNIEKEFLKEEKSSIKYRSVIRIAEINESKIPEPDLILKNIVLLSSIILNAKYIRTLKIPNLYELENIIKKKYLYMNSVYITCKSAGKDIKALVTKGKYAIMIYESSGCCRKLSEEDYETYKDLICRVFKIEV